ncbi:MAG: hypothetical protein AAF196_01165 [Planctomycetota bacterium]
MATLLLVGWWVGCTSDVRFPTDPKDPVSVYLVKNGLHRGLLLPEGDRAGVGGYVEYGYGEWEWYGCGNNSWYRVFPAVLWPTAGGLGRRRFSTRDAGALRRRLAGAELQKLIVARDRAVALRRELERRWDDGRSQLDEPPSRSFGLLFVPVDDGYWMFNNCCDEVARWLEALDCPVESVLLRFDLEVEVP